MTVLNKKDYAKFERLIEDGLKYPVGLVPTPRLNHDDLMKRINDIPNGYTSSEKDSDIGSKWIDSDTCEQWRDFDRRNGNRCFEAVFSIKAAVRFVKKLFSKGETK